MRLFWKLCNFTKWLTRDYEIRRIGQSVVERSSSVRQKEQNIHKIKKTIRVAFAWEDFPPCLRIISLQFLALTWILGSYFNLPPVRLLDLTIRTEPNRTGTNAGCLPSTYTRFIRFGVFLQAIPFDRFRACIKRWLFLLYGTLYLPPALLYIYFPTSIAQQLHLPRVVVLWRRFECAYIAMRASNM